MLLSMFNIVITVKFEITVTFMASNPNNIERNKLKKYQTVILNSPILNFWVRYHTVVPACFDLQWNHCRLRSLESAHSLKNAPGWVRRMSLMRDCNLVAQQGALYHDEWSYVEYLDTR